jgi:MATE family multidrug resistance protein
MAHRERRRTRLLREMRVSLVLALPMVAGQFAAVAMNLVDSALAGHYGPSTLAAVAVGSALWSLVLLVCIGVLMAIPPSVAQFNGAGRRDEVAPLWQQSVWLALALGLLLAVLLRSSPWFLAHFGIAAEVLPEANAFLRALSFGAPAMALYFCFRFLSEGLAWTLPTMLFGVGGLLLLLPIGYALMFGFGPVPALGAAGLGYATALVLWLQALGFLAYLRLAPRFADLCLFSHWQAPRWPPIRGLLALGLPMGVAIFMEGSLFVATALLIGRLGALDVAAHQVALNWASASFMLPLGIAMATTVRVGHAQGAGDAAGVRWAAAAGFGLVLCTQTASGLLLGVAGAWLARLLTTDPAVAALASVLLVYAAVFQFPDGIQALSAGALRGLKDTRVPMYITVLAYWGLGLPLGAWFGLQQGGRAPGLWVGLIVGLSVAAGLLSLRFWRLARRPPSCIP